MGGPSAENAVSKRSGAAVADGLRTAGYTVCEIDVRGHAVDLPDDIDLAFIALHGEFGEDGAIQKLLSERGVPYTGSDPQASQASFDKRISKRIFREAGIPTPDYEILRAGDRRALPLPVVIKPPCQGSSIGVHKVFTEAKWPAACADAFRYGEEALVETYIPGRELTVGIVGDEALPVVEIVAPGGWYGYEAKYTPGSTNYIVPALIADRTAQQCRQVALRTFRALGCRGLGRVDFRMTEAGQIYVLELNNIPGFTQTSLLPKAAEAAGIKFHELCDRIARLATL